MHIIVWSALLYRIYYRSDHHALSFCKRCSIVTMIHNYLLWHVNSNGRKYFSTIMTMKLLLNCGRVFELTFSSCIVNIFLISLRRFLSTDSQIFWSFRKYDRLTFRSVSIFSKANEHFSSFRVILPLYHDIAEFYAYFLMNQ